MIDLADRIKKSKDQSLSAKRVRGGGEEAMSRLQVSANSVWLFSKPTVSQSADICYVLQMEKQLV